jgi:curli biogenesis system outer membrane secretion channel CsgG
MKKILLLLILITASSCAVKRTRDSDKGLRVAVDSTGINQEDHAGLQNALVQSGKFYVIDRLRAFKSIKNEQDRLHRTEADRYAPAQKYAHYGKLYGVGSVVVATAKCSGAESSKNIIYFAAHLSTLGMFDRIVCEQILEIVDTNTAEVIASVRVETKKQANELMDWSDVVEELVEAYPTHFESDKKHKKLIEYEQETEKLSLK